MANQTLASRQGSRQTQFGAEGGSRSAEAILFPPAGVQSDSPESYIEKPS